MFLIQYQHNEYNIPTGYTTLLRRNDVVYPCDFLSHVSVISRELHHALVREPALEAIELLVNEWNSRNNEENFGLFLAFKRGKMIL